MIGFWSEPKATDGSRGTADKAIEDAFNVPGVQVRSYSDPLPSRQEARRYASQLGVTAKANVDSFGNFKLVGHAAPRPSHLQRLMIPFRFAISGVTLPFIVVGMVLIAVFHSGDSKANPNASIRHLFMIGVAAVATATLAIALIVRAMFVT